MEQFKPIDKQAARNALRLANMVEENIECRMLNIECRLFRVSIF